MHDIVVLGSAPVKQYGPGMQEGYTVLRGHPIFSTASASAYFDSSHAARYIQAAIRGLPASDPEGAVRRAIKPLSDQYSSSTTGKGISRFIPADRRTLDDFATMKAEAPMNDQGKRLYSRTIRL